MTLPIELDQLFAIDDGSLPEIRVEGLDQRSIEGALDLIHSAALAPAKYAHEAGSEAPPGVNHFVAKVAIGGTELPELGVASFEDAMIIDYRMGPAWDAARISALFELLSRSALSTRAPMSRSNRERIRNCGALSRRPGCCI